MHMYYTTTYICSRPTIIYTIYLDSRPYYQYKNIYTKLTVPFSMYLVITENEIKIMNNNSVCVCVCVCVCVHMLS